MLKKITLFILCLCMLTSVAFAWQEVKSNSMSVNGESVSSGKVWKEPYLGMEFVWVKGGCYEMGCGNWTDSCYYDEEPVHTVCVDGFYMGKYEVTFAQYDSFCEETGRSKPDDEGWGKGNRPVINVSWNDARAFAKWLSLKTGRKFRLPTEAEWEYAARSRGLKVKYATSTGGLSRDLANYRGIGGRDRWSYTSPVGSFPPNPLGLYDMSGNVMEWCKDVYNEKAYRHHYRNNPQCTGSGSYRVIRGGGWNGLPGSVRCAVRGNDTPDDKLYYIGFRLVLDLAK
jgi:formylglycine-generating enzyme required for sulfatase activity